MGRLSWEALGTDEEQRVWYVAITRTRKNLFYCETKRSEAFCNMRKNNILSKDDNERYCRGKSFHVKYVRASFIQFN